MGSVVVEFVVVVLADAVLVCRCGCSVVELR